MREKEGERERKGTIYVVSCNVIECICVMWCVNSLAHIYTHASAYIHTHVDTTTRTRVHAYIQKPHTHTHTHTQNQIQK